MVRRPVSFWDGPCSGVISVFGRVYCISCSLPIQIICVMKNFHSYYQSRDKPFIFEISHCNRYFSRSIDTYTYNSDIILLSYVFFGTQATEKHWSKHSLSRSVATPKKKPLWAVQLPEDMKRILESKFWSLFWLGERCSAVILVLG